MGPTDRGLPGGPPGLEGGGGDLEASLKILRAQAEGLLELNFWTSFSKFGVVGLIEGLLELV